MTCPGTPPPPPLTPLSGHGIQDDLEGLEPWVMLGLPASAVAELAIRSVETNNTNGVTLKSGKKISNLTRPRVGPGTGS